MLPGYINAYNRPLTKAEWRGIRIRKFWQRWELLIIFLAGFVAGTVRDYFINR